MGKVKLNFHYVVFLEITVNTQNRQRMIAKFFII